MDGLLLCQNLISSQKICQGPFPMNLFEKAACGWILELTNKASICGNPDSIISPFDFGRTHEAISKKAGLEALELHWAVQSQPLAYPQHRLTSNFHRMQVVLQ